MFGDFGRRPAGGGVSQQINLYNPALRPRRDVLSASGLVMAASACLVLVLVIGAIGSSRLSARKVEAAQASGQLRVAQERVAMLAAKAKNAKPDPALQAQLDRLQEQSEARAGVLAVVEQGMSSPGTGYADVLRGLARQTVTGLWLTGVSLSAGGSNLELRGRTLDRTLVGEYLHRLNDEKAFTGRSFAGMRIALPATEDAAGTGKPATRGPAYLEFVLTASGSTAGEAGGKVAKLDAQPGATGDGAGEKEKKS